MAACSHCGAETELYDSGVPVCLKCSVERDCKTAKKPPVACRSIQNLLVDEVIQATSRTNKAAEAFLETMGHIPSGFPHPDGYQRIHNVSRELSIARKDLMRAHTRLDDYLRAGIVPEDLKRNAG
jgi:hypothetical protein